MKFHDRTKETTTTTGTGNITLAGAVSQFVAFSSVFQVNDVFYYSIVGQTGTEWEVGIGRLVDSSTLERTIVYESSNSNALVNFSSGDKDVFCTIPAFFITRLETMGHTLAKSLGYDMA